MVWINILHLLDVATYTVFKACQKDYVNLKIGHFVSTFLLVKLQSTIHGKYMS